MNDNRPAGREVLGLDDEYALRWRTTRGVLTVWLDECGRRRRDDVPHELGKVALVAPDAERRAFWRQVRHKLAALLDVEYAADLRAEGLQLIAELVPDPAPERLAGGLGQFVDWLYMFDTETLDLVAGLFTPDAPLLRQMRWLVSLPPAVQAHLADLVDALVAFAPEPRTPYDYDAAIPIETAGAMHIVQRADGRTESQRVTAEDVDRWARARNQRQADYRQAFETYPARLAAWRLSRRALIEHHVRAAGDEVQAWLEANPPPPWEA